VDPAVDIQGEAAGGVLWVWIRGGWMGGELVRAPLEQRLFRYGLSIPPPPGGDHVTGEAPPTWRDEDLLVGLPLLVDLPSADAAMPTPDPLALLSWLEQPGGELAGLPVAAWPSDHLLIARDASSAVDRLGQVPGWTGPCSLGDVQRGLTLYRRDHADCGGWRAVAAPGTRTEFQGVEMVAAVGITSR